MEKAKSSSIIAVIITIVLTTLVVGGSSYYMFTKQVDELAQQIQDLQSQELEVPVEPKTNIPEKVATANNDKSTECYKTYTEDNISFDYPCDWETNVKNMNSWAAVGTVVAPDGKASFHYPAPEFGLQGMELTDEAFITINGTDYPSETYVGNGQTIVIIKMGTAINNYEYNLMLAYESSEYEDEFEHIFETFKF